MKSRLKSRQVLWRTRWKLEGENVHVGRSWDWAGIQHLRSRHWAGQWSPEELQQVGEFKQHPAPAAFRDIAGRGSAHKISYARAHTQEGAQRHSARWGSPIDPVREIQDPALVPPRRPWGDTSTVPTMMSEQEPQSTLWTLWKHILTQMSVYIELKCKNCRSCYFYKEESGLLERHTQQAERAGGWKEDSIRKYFLGRRSSAQGNQIVSLWLLSILHFTPTFLPLPLFATGHEVPELRSPLNDGTNENSPLTLKGRNWARAEKTSLLWIYSSLMISS